jgi:hypothetical protein
LDDPNDRVQEDANIVDIDHSGQVREADCGGHVEATDLTEAANTVEPAVRPAPAAALVKEEQLRCRHPTGNWPEQGVLRHHTGQAELVGGVSMGCEIAMSGAA